MSGANLPPADELASIRDQIKALEAREAVLRTVLLDDPTARTGNLYLAEIKEAAQTRTDLKEMRAMYPKIVEEFTFTSTVKRIVLRGITEDGEIVSTSRSEAERASARRKE